MKTKILLTFSVIFFILFSTNVLAEEIVTYTPSSETHCVNGVCTETYFIDRTFYEENGAWNPINNTFYFNGTHWIADKNNFKVYVRNNIVILKGENEAKVSFTIPTSNLPSVNDNTITYWITGANTNVSVLLTLASEGLEKLITIYDINRNKNYDNYVEYLNKTMSKSRFIIGDLKIWYNQCNATDCWNVYYPANWTDNGGFSINKTWIDSAVFPIYIDPTVVYNFTVVNGNKAYAQSNNTAAPATVSADYSASTTEPPTFAEIYSSNSINITSAAYGWISAVGGSWANITSSGNNFEPLAYFNFTTKPKASINWINVTMTQREHYKVPDDNCFYYIANWTSGTVFAFGAVVSTTTFTTRSMNFTTATDIERIVDANNVVSLVTGGCTADAAEGCDIDFVQVEVNYNSTMTFSNPENNNSAAKPNDQVNFTMTVTTNNDDISHYLFSSNFSDGTWRNSSWVAMSGTQTTGTMWNVTTSTTANIYGWKFCANTSTNYVNCSDIQAFNFTTKTLLVNWTNYNAQSEINATTCTFGSPCSYTQYSTFNASANVSCLTNPAGQSCGSITGGIMYNDTASTYSWVSTTADATPFYLSGGGQITCTNLTNLGDAYVSNATGATDINFGTSAYVPIQSGPAVLGNSRAFIKFNTSFNSTPINSIINATLYLSYGEFVNSDPAGRTYNLYNTTDNTSMVNSPWWEGNQNGAACSPPDCLTWNNQTSIGTLQSTQTVPASYGWMSWTIGEAISSSFNAGKNISLMIRDSSENSVTAYDAIFNSKEYGALVPYLTVCYNTGVSNPSSIGTLNDGSSYLLNYTVNATDTPTKFFNFTFNFTSDNSAVAMNRTPDAFVRIGTAGPQTYPRTVLQQLNLLQSSSRGANIFKTQTQYLSINQSSGRTRGIISTLSSYLSVLQAISRILSSYKSLTSSLTISQSFSRISNFFRTLPQSFILNDVASKSLLFVQTLFQSFNINTITSRVITFTTLVSQSLTFSTAISRLQNLIKSLTQTITTNEVISRLATLYKSLPQPLTTNTITGRVLTVLKEVPQSFTINIISSRIASLSKAVTNSLTLNIVSSRISSFFLTTNQSLGINTAISRLLTLIKSVSQSMLINLTTFRTGLFFKSLTDSFTANITTTRISNFYRTISGSFLITESSSRIRTVLTSISEFFSISISASRLYSSLRSITSYFTTTLTTSRIPTRLASLSESLSLTTISSRLSSLLRLITDYFSIASTTSRISTLYKSISSYFTTAVSTSRLYLSLRQASSYFTTSLSAIRQSTLYKTITSYFTTTVEISRIATFVRSTTGYFTLSQTTVRIQYLIKSLSQFFTLNTISTRISSIFKTASDSFTANAITSRFIGFYKSAAQSLAIDTIATKTQMLIKNIIQSFSTILTSIGTKLGVNEKIVSLSLTISGSPTRLLSLYKTLTQSFIANDIISKTGMFIKSLSQSLTTSLISSRIYLSLKTISTSINIYSAVTSRLYYLRSITGSFITYLATSRISLLSKTLVESLNMNIITERTSLLLRTLTDSFTTNIAISRTVLFFKSISDTITTTLTVVGTKLGFYTKTVELALTITDSTTRLLNLYKSISQSLTANIITGRMLIAIKSISDSFALSSISSRGLVFVKSISDSFSLNTLSSRLTMLLRSVTGTIMSNIMSTRIISIFRTTSDTFGIIDSIAKSSLFLKSLIQPISSNAITGRLIGFYKGISGSFILTESTTRIISLNRILGESISLNIITGRFSIVLKYSTSTVSLTSITSRLLTFSRALSQGIPITGMMIRTQSLIRIFSQQFSTTLTATGFKPGVLNERITALSLTLSSSIQRTISITRIISQSLNLNIAFSRLLSLIRLISQFFEIGGTASGLRPVICAAQPTESSCASAGCYWCSGTCQATTCPQPPSGGGGGGGGYTPPKNVTNISEVAFDVEVNIENEQVVPGDRVYATVSLLKYAGPNITTDINLTYWIETPEGKILSMKEAVVGVETLRKNIYFLTVPIDSELGLYKFKIIGKYNHFSTVASTTFNVVSTLPEVLITANVSVPRTLVNITFNISLSLKNKVDKQLDANITLLLPNNFEPSTAVKNITLGHLANYTIDFETKSNEAGIFTGLIKIEYNGNKIVKDFSITVYSAEIGYILLIKDYWWIVIAIIVAILAILFVVLKRRRQKLKRISNLEKIRDRINVTYGANT